MVGLQVRRPVDPARPSSDADARADPSGFGRDDLPPLFELLGRLAHAIVATVGPDAEVVVHDLRTPEHSVVAISGTLTGRTVGAPVPDPELLPGEVDRFTVDDLRRRATTPTGRELVASTVWVRDRTGHVVGAVCVNVDHTGLRHARELIDRHLGPGGLAAPVTPSFAATVDDVVRLGIERHLGPANPRRLRATERLELIRRLDADGVFALRRAPDTVAAELSISRASVYADLRKARAFTATWAGREGVEAPAPDAATARPPRTGRAAPRRAARAEGGPGRKRRAGQLPAE